jgi:hypothetical protein
LARSFRSSGRSSRDVKIVEKIALPESTGFDAYPADDYEPKPAEEGHYTTDRVAGDDPETEPMSPLDERSVARWRPSLSRPSSRLIPPQWRDTTTPTTAPIVVPPASPSAAGSRTCEALPSRATWR